MIEAMACGTPVLAFHRGSVDELVEQGVTGEIVDSIESAILALPRVLALNRRTVRRRFEDRFSSTRMAKNYLRVYKLLGTQSRTLVSGRATKRETPVRRGIEPNEPVI
jgi:glycosyltransferase involved in cell wall biosynthesis